jgi:hypothetical protein
MHELRRRALLQGVRGGLQEMPRRVPSDAAVSAITSCRILCWPRFIVA